jgi:dTMP kinase
VTTGRFITFEGGEGAGKSTQIRRLEAALAAAGHDVLVSREPGGSPGAEYLREVVLSGAAKPFGPFAETLLFAAARDDHLEHTIRPAIEAGRWVLCDRFMDSTRAYQGVMGDVDPGLIRSVERVVVGSSRPDLTILLDIPAREGLRRASSRGGFVDRFESEGLVFHERLRHAFLAIAQSDSARCVVVDANRDADAVAATIHKIVNERFPEAFADASR